MEAKTNFKKAFTMAEAILVMTILGIIAAVMLSTLKPTQWKDKSYQILAKKVLYEIDTATTNILTTNSKYGNISSLVFDNGTSLGSSPTVANVWILYKKYLSTVRENAADYCKTPITGKSFTAYKLKDGACMGIIFDTSTQATQFPGETSASNSITGVKGYIAFDTNDKEEPNIPGKDQFVIPFDDLGIKYE